MNTTSSVSTSERQGILQAEIDRLLAKGKAWDTGHGRWRLMSQTETTAQMVRPKTFSAAIAILWFVFVPVIGLIFYVIYYAGKRDQHLYLTVDDIGELKKHLS